MTTPNRPPLWRVMDRAAYPQPHPPGHNYRAAEIRALRDWLVPEGAEWPNADERWPEDINTPQDWMYGGVEHAERQRLRSLLTAEADRAERGDG